MARLPSLSKSGVAIAAAFGLSAFQGAYAACSAENCSACAELECSTTTGCFDLSVGEYDPKLCQTGEALAELEAAAPADPTIHDQCVSDVFSGVGLGLFLGGVTVLSVLHWSKQRYNEQLLLAPDSAVRRASATLKLKGEENTEVESEDGSTTVDHDFYLTLEFFALHSDGSRHKVLATTRIDRTLYSECSEGSQIEVLFPVDKEREFEVVGNLLVNRITVGKAAQFVVAVVVAIVGIVTMGMPLLASDCDFPFGVFAILAVTLTEGFFTHLVGSFFLKKLRRLANNARQIQVTPASFVA